MKIGLITTLDTNIGDDFIREGVCLVLRSVFKGKRIEFRPVNKHKPHTIYPSWHPARFADPFIKKTLPGASLLKKFQKELPKIGLSHFDGCDLIVQCGAPVFWPDCHLSEWAEPIWRQVIGRLHEKIPVLNLAAGSCYPWEKQPDALSGPDLQFAQEILGYCRLTIVRDRLARDLCLSAGKAAPLIPCSAFLAAGQRGKADGPVLINYMKGGGHYDWGQGIDPEGWKEAAETLIQRLKNRHNLAFICHNQAEFDEAGALAPGLPRLFPKTAQEYFTAVAGAKAAVCNRVHASVGMAGMGIPSIAIGTDTRLLMVRELGLKAVYVKDATTSMLEDEVEEMIAKRDTISERLLSLKAQTFKRYEDAIKGAL